MYLHYRDFFPNCCSDRVHAISFGDTRIACFAVMDAAWGETSLDRVILHLDLDAFYAQVYFFPFPLVNSQLQENVLFVVYQTGGVSSPVQFHI